MQKDYHYYAVYQLARLAGFVRGDAETIAYASQYVDDSTESEPIEPYPGQYFDTARTAHYELGAFNWNVQKKIYMPFHFLPAKIRWESPETFSYVTELATGDDTELATMIVKEALRETDAIFKLVKLGIALHAVADTFSHVGFSGRHHDENNVGRIWHAKNGGWKLKFLESFVSDVFVPRIGHVEALHYPDYPYLKWRYTDDGGDMKPRNNLDYSIKGAKLIYRFLKMAKSGSGVVSDLKKDCPDEFREISRLFENTGTLETRCGKWRDYTGAPKYSKKKWRQEALKGKVDWDDKSPTELKVSMRELKGKAGFDSSKWAYFHRAALKQRSLVIGWLN